MNASIAKSISTFARFPFFLYGLTISLSVCVLITNSNPAYGQMPSEIEPSFNSTAFILSLRDEKDSQAGARKIVKALLNDSLEILEPHPKADPSAVAHLKALYNQVDQVQYKFAYGQMTELGLRDCHSNMDSQWFLKSDNPLGPYPLVIWKHGFDTREFSMDRWQLLVHETISALGVVDGAYQVSSTLEDIKIFSQDEEFSDVERLKIQIQSHTPKFQLGTEESCSNRGGSTSGVGGGGHGTAMAFKRTMNIYLAEWWEQNKGSSRSRKFRMFRNIIMDLGVEPLELNPKFESTAFMAMEFVKSKRTHRLTVRLDLDSKEPWGFPLNRIFNHVHKYIFRSKNVHDHNDHFVYGSELAERRGLIPVGTWKRHAKREKPFRKKLRDLLE